MDTQLTRAMRDLELSQSSLDSVLQERDQWKSKFFKTQQELFEIIGESTRDIYNLACVTEENLKLKNDLSIQKAAVADLTSKNFHLQEQHLAGKVELEELVLTFQRTLADNDGDPAVATHRQLGELQEQIHDLRETNQLLEALSHKEMDCKQYSTRVWEQLQDARTLQSAAEAETEGLRHIEVQNELLQEAHVADAELIADLLMTNANFEGGKSLKSGSSLGDSHAKFDTYGIDSSDLPSVSHSPNAGMLSSQVTPPAFYGRSSPITSTENSSGSTISFSSNPPLPIAASGRRPVTLF